MADDALTQKQITAINAEMRRLNSQRDLIIDPPANAKSYINIIKKEAQELNDKMNKGRADQDDLQDFRDTVSRQVNRLEYRSKRFAKNNPELSEDLQGIADIFNDTVKNMDATIKLGEHLKKSSQSLTEQAQTILAKATISDPEFAKELTPLMTNIVAFDKLQQSIDAIKNPAEKTKVQATYKDVAKTTQRLLSDAKDGEIDIENYKHLYASTTIAREELNAISYPSDETKKLMGNLDRTLANVSTLIENQQGQGTGKPKSPGQPPARDTDQIEDIAIQIANAAQSAFKAAGPKMREWKSNTRTLRDLANQTKENPTEGNLEALNTQLDKTIQFLDSKRKEFPNSEPGKRRTREAPRRHDLLEGLQQELQKAAPELNQTTSTELPKDIMLAAKQALNPAVPQQDAMASNYDNKSPHTSIPDGNGANIGRYT